MLATLSFVLLTLDFRPFARGSSPTTLRPLLIEKLPFFALSGVTTLVTVLMPQRTDSFVLDLPFGARAGNTGVSRRHLGKLFGLSISSSATRLPAPGRGPSCSPRRRSR